MPMARLPDEAMLMHRAGLAALTAACAALALLGPPSALGAPPGQEGDEGVPIETCEGHHSCGQPCEVCHWDNRGSKVLEAQQAEEMEASAQAVADLLSRRVNRAWFRAPVQYAPARGDVWIVGGRALRADSLPDAVRFSPLAAPGQWIEVRAVQQPDGSYAARRAVLCGADDVCLRPLPASGAALTEDVAPAAVDPVDLGRLVFLKAGCTACHTITGVSQGTVGPALDHVAEDAARIMAQEDYRASEGKASTPREFIREAIVDPNVYVLPDCPLAPCTGHLKPENFEELLTPEELEAVIDYLMSLGGGSAP
jgi:mono/diheme cytochrome c family protein